MTHLSHPLCCMLTSHTTSSNFNLKPTQEKYQLTKHIATPYKLQRTSLNIQFSQIEGMGNAHNSKYHKSGDIGFPSKEHIDDFLNNKHREKFMTKFIIGDEKEEFYGYSLLMARSSRLVAGLLEKDPPYFFLSDKKISKPIFTTFWLTLNKQCNPLVITNITVKDLLDLGLLIDYFDVMPQDIIYTDWYSKFSIALASEDKKQQKILIENKDQVANLVHNLIKLGEMEIMYHIHQIPEIAEKIIYVPIFARIATQQRKFYKLVKRDEVKDTLKAIEPISLVKQLFGKSYEFYVHMQVDERYHVVFIDFHLSFDMVVASCHQGATVAS